MHVTTHWDSENICGDVTGTALLGLGHCHYSLYASKKLFAIIALSQLSGILRTCVWESPQLYCNNSLRASVRESLQVLYLTFILDCTQHFLVAMLSIGIRWISWNMSCSYPQAWSGSKVFNSNLTTCIFIIITQLARGQTYPMHDIYKLNCPCVHNKQ